MIKSAFKNLLFFCVAVLAWRATHGMPIWANVLPRYIIFAATSSVVLALFPWSIPVLSFMLILWVGAAGVYPLGAFFFVFLIAYALLAIYMRSWESGIVFILFICNILYTDIKVAAVIINSPVTTVTPDFSSDAYATMSAKVRNSRVGCDRVAFLTEVRRICAKHNIDPVHLLFVMWAESGISTTAVNPNGNATGLIQFMPTTSTNLGVAHSTVAAMDGITQLSLVDKYLTMFDSRINKCTDIYMFYMIFFYPAAIDEISSTGNYKFSDKVVSANNVIFHGGNSYAEFKRYVNKRALIAGIMI